MGAGVLAGDMLTIAVDDLGRAVMGALLPAGTRRGTVVFLADLNTFVPSRSMGDPFRNRDNRALWENIFAFAVPEPASVLLLGAGAAGLALRARRRR